MSTNAGLRPLKHHEKKLLKKVDFLQWKGEHNVREIQVIRRYHLQDREDYSRYNKLVGHITKLAENLKTYGERDTFRITMTEKLLKKLYDMGLIPTQKSLALIDRVTVSSFCRRRLPVVMVTNKYAQTLREAVTFIEQVGRADCQETSVPHAVGHGSTKVACRAPQCLLLSARFSHIPETRPPTRLSVTRRSACPFLMRACVPMVDCPKAPLLSTCAPCMYVGVCR
jgi:U3 small nucleolar ribonucleoprotein protein IMP3